MGESQVYGPPPPFTKLFSSRDPRVVEHAMAAIEEIPRELHGRLRVILFAFQRAQRTWHHVAEVERTSGARMRRDAERLVTELERFRRLYLEGFDMLEGTINFLRGLTALRRDGRRRYAHYHAAMRQIEQLGASPDGARAMLLAMGAAISPGRPARIN